jgi:hypothetical protein
MLDTTTTMFVFLVAMVASQLIGRKALKTLTPEQKLSLLESSPKVPSTLIFIAVAYGIQSWLSARFGHSAAFLGGFMLVLICGLLLSCPAAYLRTFVIGQCIVLLALGVMFWSSYSSFRDIDARTQKLLNDTTRTN